MKIETLRDRIEKAESKLIKINGTLDRHNSQLIKKAKALTDSGIDLNNYDKYDRNIINHDAYWDLCDYEHKLEDIENTNKKIRETTKTLEGLQDQLNNQLAKDEENNSIIPEVLNIFLENWKQKCFEYYTVLANEYITLVSKKHSEYEITKEELEKLEKREYDSKKHRYMDIKRYDDEEIENILNGNIKEGEIEDLKVDIRSRHIKQFVTGHFASDMAVLDKIIERSIINNVTLNKILDYDVKVKKEMFISRIKEVIGEIKDLSGLRIGAKGDINGIAKGIKCNAKVETIGAGGYNIQCWHFRVLVNTIN